ncbi:PREDICTED: uncharacterized protein LOC106821156 [Priapulus caudatus]|uniref:Uncharacterized protein LOC106821156 n=1 Tax=Priapulus caudatus TaxID=37621 RepID=A0ABM1FA60_PRICU|nr:PREDICTED: uncharacterized protein LOC106821156 [Priapulus caudatus]
MELFPCEQPVKLLLFANSDAFNLHNFSRNFTDKESIKIQGLSINFGPPFGKVEGFITTDLQRNQNVVALTLTVRGHVVGSPLPIGEWPDALTTELISNYEFAIPNCPIPVPGAVTLPNSVQDIEQFVESEINAQEKSSGTQTFNNCTRGFLGQCRVKETCVLKPDSREGLCQCELGYKLDRVGQCTRKESGQSTIGPTNVAPTVSHNSSSSSTSAPKSFEEKKTTITAVVGAVGTCALLGVIAAVFVVLRRRRAQANQAYTMVANFSDDDDAQLIGQNEELA